MEKSNCEPAVALMWQKKIVFRKIFAKGNTAISD